MVSCTYKWYLDATAGAEQNLSIQRGIIKDSKAYQTLRADLRRGCILPPLVLAVSNMTLPEILNARRATSGAELQATASQIETQLSAPRPQDTYIIDGLQRTNALRQTLREMESLFTDREQFLNRLLRVEVWLNIPFGAIAYRMLLLNAGQKPMSMKHQVEILSIKLAEDLSTIPGIKIINTLTSERRVAAGQFTLAKLASAFHAWLQGSPNIDFRNTVMEQLLAESAIETLGTSLSGAEPHEDFRSFVEWIVAVDHAVWDSEPQFFGNETVLLGLSAAVGTAQRNTVLRDRMLRGLERLKNQVTTGNPEALAIHRFNELRQGEDVRKVNVGQFTRDMVYRAFHEYFLSDGTKPMEDCWAFGAAQS
jgi:hypothetical protein